MTIKELEERLDQGDDLDDCTDWENPTWCSNEKTRFSINIPEWLMYHLDEEADRRVTPGFGRRPRHPKPACKSLTGPQG